MSAPLVVSIPHRLGREEAVRRLRGGLARAAASVPIMTVDEETWNGDKMFFRVRALGQAASGNIDVADDHVRVEVMLPWLLQRFAQVAQTAIRDRGTLLLIVDYIIETFPIVKRKDEQRYGTFRTKELTLKIFDAMTEASRTGKSYQTILDPPPGKGPRHG
jgi:hypothetical protein